MEQYKIEKKPMPVSEAKCKYPFASMEVGDSIYVTGVKKDSLLSYARYWCAKNSFKASWYAEMENRGVRIWRRR